MYRILDPSGHELLAFHWHPGAAGPAFPHLHLSSRIGDLPIGGNEPPVALGSMHIPTGPVLLAAVARVLIAEFDIAPRRADWAEAIAVAEAARGGTRPDPA